MVWKSKFMLLFVYYFAWVLRWQWDFFFFFWGFGLYLFLKLGNGHKKDNFKFSTKKGMGERLIQNLWFLFGCMGSLSLCAHWLTANFGPKDFIVHGATLAGPYAIR